MAGRLVGWLDGVEAVTADSSRLDVQIGAGIESKIEKKKYEFILPESRI